MQRKLVLFCSLLLIVTTVWGATIHGQVYNAEDFTVVNQAIVVVESTPIQKKVIDQNGFSFTISNQGSIELKAFVVENQKVVAIGSDHITVEANGDYQLDLIVYPALDLNGNLATILNQSTEPARINENNDNNSISWLLVGLMVLIIVGLISWGQIMVHQQQRSLSLTQSIESNPPRKEFAFSNEQKKAVTALLSARGGRMLQKEVRTTLDWGEAYLSLIVAELEHDGVIKKIKHGRGNILILQHEI